MDSPVSPKDEIWFLRVCHYIHQNAVARRIVTIIEPVSKFDGPPRCTMSDVELKSTSYFAGFYIGFS
jgi:hypothetical protein